MTYNITLLFIQTNGLTERFNQTLSRCLAKVIDDGQEDWDEKLETVLMGYRASRQATTKHSPYYMLFQKEMRLPIDNEVMPQEDSAEVDVSELMEKLLKTRKQAFADVDANIKSAQKKQKETYDRKHQPAIFAVGTEVLLENTKQKQRKGGKLENLWLGPYIVHQHVGKGVYQLRNMAGEVLTKKVNISRLKKYTRREQEVHESRKKTEEESSDEERNKEVVEGEDMEGLSTIGVKKRKCLATSPKKAKRQKYDVIDDANVEDLEKPWVTVGSV